MRRFSLYVVVVWMLPILAVAQFRTQPSIKDALTSPTTALGGLFSPERFQMQHTFSVGFMSFGGGNSLMMNSYVNTINYRFNNNLFLRLNLGLFSTPYNTFSGNVQQNTTQFFGGAELMYRPNDKMQFYIGVHKGPQFTRPYYPGNYYRTPFSTTDERSY